MLQTQYYSCNENWILCRDGEDLDSQGDGSSQPDTISIASRTSQNTLDSDKVSFPAIALCWEQMIRPLVWISTQD